MFQKKVAHIAGEMGRSVVPHALPAKAKDLSWYLNRSLHVHAVMEQELQGVAGVRPAAGQVMQMLSQIP